jgi:predicted nucleotidyltransferase
MLTQPLLNMLAGLEKVFAELDIDFYIVGAVARDIQFSLKDENIRARATEDVDIAVMVSDQAQYTAIKNALIASGEFTAHETEAIKLYYQNAIEIDLLPFGDIENEQREIKLTDPMFILNMPGFSEVFPYAEAIQLSEELNIRVCTLEGIILLKLIANNDRPSRTKDITDIEHIIANYYDISDADIYSDHFEVMDYYDTKDREYIPLVCARVIGRKIGQLLQESPELHERIAKILTGRPTTLWNAMLDGLNDN